VLYSLTKIFLLTSGHPVYIQGVQAINGRTLASKRPDVRIGQYLEINISLINAKS